MIELGRVMEGERNSTIKRERDKERERERGLHRERKIIIRG